MGGTVKLRGSCMLCRFLCSWNSKPFFVNASSVFLFSPLRNDGASCTYVHNRISSIFLDLCVAIITLEDRCVLKALWPKWPTGKFK
jgi:hypothetical protein